MSLFDLIKDRIFEKELYENNLFTDAASRDALLNSKNNIAEAFIFNFFGILGILNATDHPNDKAMMKRYFMADKKIRLDSITDDNNDMSLVVKLAHEADFFKNDIVVNKITRFLAKVKLGQVLEVDTKIVAGWANALKPDFIRYISDPKLRASFIEFRDDKGETIDISRFAIALKKKANKVSYSGDFKIFAKRFRLHENPVRVLSASVDPQNDPTTIAPTSTVSLDPNVPIKRGRGRPRKILGSIAPIATPVVPAIMPPKGLSTRLTFSELFDNGFIDNNNTSYYLNKLKRAVSNKKLTSKDFDYIDEIRQKLIVQYDKILELQISSVHEELVKMIDYINDANLLNVPLTLETFFAEINRYTNSNTNRLTDDVKRIYLLETNNASNASFTYRIYSMLLKLDKSKLTNKEELAKRFIDTITYEKILDRYIWGSFKNDDSTEFIQIANGYLYKCAVDNIDFYTLYKRFIKDRRIMSTMLSILHEGSKYFKQTVLFDVSLATVMKNQIDNFNNIKFDETTIKPIISEYSSMQTNERLKSIFFPIMSKRYYDDIIAKGWQNSLAAAENMSSSLITDFGISFEDLSARFPKDMKLIEIAMDKNNYYVDKLPLDTVENYIHYKSTTGFKESLRINTMSDDEVQNQYSYPVYFLNTYNNMLRKTKDINSISSILIKEIDRNPQIYDSPSNFHRIMRNLSRMDKSVVMDLMRSMKRNNIKKMLSPITYNDLSSKQNKDEFVTIFTGIVNDSMGTDLEDYVSDIMEEMPGSVINKMRGDLLGINKLVEEVKSGQVKLFHNLDSARLKQMLTMNDINFSSLVTKDVGRKKKNEKWAEYFKRAKDSTSNKKILEPEKITEASDDLKSLTKTFNKNHRSGKHGDNFAKIIKAYNSTLEFPEFQQFRQSNKGDDPIIPAFHGTSGIAASMILRYGFKVIKSTDSSVAGRMMGDGIYFSNKIDKSLQYVGITSNVVRNYGAKGYIFELDVNMGKRAKTDNGPDYRVMGLGNDNIRSPEWVVRDPKAQVAIRKVYEVQIMSGSDFKSYLNEETGLKGFRQYLEEKVIEQQPKSISFTFRDGKIPIFVKKENEIKLIHLDFEDALAQKYITYKNLDYSRNGPVVVFDNTETQEIFDIRFAETMYGEEYSLYEKYFKKQLLNIEV